MGIGGPVPNFSARCSSGRGFGENIATLVLACARVTFNPNPFDIKTCAGRVKPLPEVRVDNQARLNSPLWPSPPDGLEVV
jgi:hypothetical protein